jgi:hypothetical protein
MASAMDRAAYLDAYYWAEYVEQDTFCSDYFLAIPFTLGADMPRAVQTLWSHQALAGPWRQRDAFLSAPDAFSLELYGLITIPGCDTIGCRSKVIPDIDEWLYLEIPYRMLQRIFPVQMPLDLARNPWMSTVDGMLVEIADAVYREVPFACAAIGGYVPGLTYKDARLSFSEMDCSNGNILLSPSLWEQLQPPEKPIVTPSGLYWIQRKA